MSQYFAEAQWTMERKLLASWSYQVALARLILRRPKNRPIWLRCVVEFAVIIDLHTAVGSSWNERFYVPVCKIGTDGICIISLIGQKRLRCPLRQRDQRVTGFAIRRFADCQVEGEWPSSSVSQTVKLTGEPAPRAARSASTSPPFAPAAGT